MFFDSGSRKNRQVKTVIFIHGGAGCLLNWKNQLPYFAEKYRTIAYDWRGCGDSDEAKSYTFDDHYDDFLSLLRLLEIPPRPILVAHSYGCLIARKYISRYQIDKLVNIALGSSGKEGGWLRSLFYFPKLFQRLVYQHLLVPKNVTLARWLLFSKTTPISEIKELLRENRIPSLEFCLALKSFSKKKLRGWVKNCQGKTLVMGGKEDRIVKPEEIRQLGKSIFQSKLEIIEKAGHFVPFEASEHFNNLVEGFISK